MQEIDLRGQTLSDLGVKATKPLTPTGRNARHCSTATGFNRCCWILSHMYPRTLGYRNRLAV
jgi:hypothetical protein